MNNKIRWTDAELNQVFGEASKLPVASWKYIWPKAQMVLPTHRQRRLSQSSVVSQLTKRYLSWKEEPGHSTARSVDDKPGISKPSMPPEHASQQPVTQPSPSIIVLERPVVKEPDYGKIPTVTLARILLERLSALEAMQEALTKFQAAVDEKTNLERTYDSRLETRHHGTFEPPVVVDKKLRIAVIGPLESQMREIETRAETLPKAVDLRFVDKEKNRDIPPSVDYIIVTRHVSHAYWEHAKSTLPADRVFFVEGGVTPVVQKLYDICSRQ